jgi:hypothetical protein
MKYKSPITYHSKDMDNLSHKTDHQHIARMQIEIYLVNMDNVKVYKK